MSKSESVRSSTVKGVTVVKAEPAQWMQMWNEKMTTLSIQRDIATAKLVDTDFSIHLVQIMFLSEGHNGFITDIPLPPPLRMGTPPGGRASGLASKDRLAASWCTRPGSAP